jgi:hypothetical protein
VSDRARQADIDAIQTALQQTSELLHQIVSRSDIKQISAEVLRLNEAVRRSHSKWRSSARFCDDAFG